MLHTSGYIILLVHVYDGVSYHVCWKTFDEYFVSFVLGSLEAEQEAAQLELCGGPGVLGLLHGVAHPQHLPRHLPALPVTAQVLLHVRLLLEALATDRAGEGALARVHPPVLPQVVLGGKLFSTYGTI